MKSIFKKQSICLHYTEVSVKTKLVANIGPPNPKKVRQTSLKEAETRKELLPGQSQ